MASSRTAVPLLVLLVLALLAGCSSAKPAASWSGDASPSDQASAVSDSPAASPTDPASPSPYGSAASPSPSRTRAPGPSVPPQPPLPGVSPAAQAVLVEVNHQRALAGLPPYTMLPGLIASAHKHNLVMAGGCGLSHQCPNEPPFGTRISNQGVHWSSAGENIGESGPNSNTTSAITKAAVGLDDAMYREQPPDDGHRRNILSRGFTHIGIDVIRDSHGTVWLTQDFTN